MAARMKKWYNTESEELEDIPFPLPEKHMDCGRDEEEGADLHDMFKHEVGMENEWEEMGKVERRQEPGVMWHIQEMEKEDPISDMTADDVQAVFGDNGMGAVMVGEFTIPLGCIHGTLVLQGSRQRDRANQQGQDEESLGV